MELWCVYVGGWGSLLIGIVGDKCIFILVFVGVIMG